MCAPAGSSSVVGELINAVLYGLLEVNDSMPSGEMANRWLPAGEKEEDSTTSNSKKKGSSGVKLDKNASLLCDTYFSMLHCAFFVRLLQKALAPGAASGNKDGTDLNSHQKKNFMHKVHANVFLPPYLRNAR